jgi:alpha-L-arabinofuranosidase
MVLTCTAIPAYAKSGAVLNVSAQNISHEVSNNLYGISLEDISYAADGGLVSNLVNNNSFECADEPENAWVFKNVSAVLSTSDPMNQNNPSYETFTIDGKGEIKNLGFTELYNDKSYDYSSKKANTADMGFEEGVTYDFSCYLKNVDFDGTISVYLDSKNNSDNIVQLSTSNVSTKAWTKVSTTIKSSATEDGALAIKFEGSGSVSLDFVTLTAQNSHGYATNEWKYVTLREDLYEAIENLHPSFIRFPSGCGSESTELSSLYSWKNTIGDITERIQTTNVWSNKDNGNYYNNSNSMGFHEYFQLCEDVGADAVPVVSAGVICQENSEYDTFVNALKKVNMTDDEWTTYLVESLGYSEKDTDAISSYTDYINSLGINNTEDFENYLDTIALNPDSDEFANYAQDILDLIEYANGDAVSTYWGALRSANGHTEPFNLKYIAVGNDNWGEVYFRNFEALKKIINDKYPDITVICSSGKTYDGDDFEYSWEQINSSYNDVIVDENCTAQDGYYFSNNSRYDSYDRDGASVMVGEYAVTSSIGTMITKNNITSAVEEASFMTGFERNSDLVKMTSYDKTFAKINANNSDVNMIWFDSQDVVYTPNYYVQMLFANNVGNEYIDTDLGEDYENVYQSVTVDEDKQVIYIKLVNNGTAQSVTVNLDGFDDINYVSKQSISDGYKSSSNELNKQRIAPVDEEIDVTSNSFTVQLNQNSVNVVRVAYGENTGEHIYQLPQNIDYTTKNYVPTGVKVIFACVCLAIPVGAVIGYMLYVKVISKKKKGRE